MIRNTLLTLTALAAAASAQAATYQFTGSFDSTPAQVALIGTFSFDDTSHALTALDFFFQPVQNGGVQGLTLPAGFNPADYYVEFDGNTVVGPNGLFATNGGGQLELQSFFGSSNFTYSIGGADQLGTLTVSAAVPEPESYALMLGGLGVVGFIARRRKA